MLGRKNDVSLVEELLECLYLIPVGIVKFDSDGSIDLINPMASSSLMPHSLDGELDNVYVVFKYLSPDLDSRNTEFPRTTGKVVDKQRLETRVEGESTTLSLSVYRVNRRTSVAVIEDVSKAALQEKRIFDDREKFRAIFDHVRDHVIYTITSDRTIEEWNHPIRSKTANLVASVLPKRSSPRSVRIDETPRASERQAYQNWVGTSVWNTTRRSPPRRSFPWSRTATSTKTTSRTFASTDRNQKRASRERPSRARARLALTAVCSGERRYTVRHIPRVRDERGDGCAGTHESIRDDRDAFTAAMGALPATRFEGGTERDRARRGDAFTKFATRRAGRPRALSIFRRCGYERRIEFVGDGAARRRRRNVRPMR